MEKYGYGFSFGPWNIHERADPLGSPVRPSRTFADKLGIYRELRFDGCNSTTTQCLSECDHGTLSMICRRSLGGHLTGLLSGSKGSNSSHCSSDSSPLLIDRHYTAAEWGL